MIEILLIYMFLVFILNIGKKQTGVLSCGLIGYSGEQPANVDKLNFLMYINSVKRGLHSTGIYSQETGLLKETGEAVDFLQKHKLPETTLFIGHVRHATVGEKNIVNAHPFEFDNLVGAHNGTLTNHWQILREKGYDSRDYNVDSQVLYKLLDDDSKKENEEKPFTTLSEYEGAAALLFTDKRNPNRLYVYKNIERPLFKGLIDGNVYFSSLDEGLKIIGCTNIESVFSNRLYIFENGKKVSDEFYKVKEKLTPSYGYYGANYRNNVNSPLTKSDEFIKAFVDNLQLATINNNELNGKWLKCIMSVKEHNNKPVSVEEGEYYFVKSWNHKNNYEIEIIDEKRNKVYVPKFWFDLTNINFKEYATLMESIEDTEQKKVVYIEGQVVKIDSLENLLTKKYIKVSSLETDVLTYSVSSEYLRPSTTDEIKVALEEFTEEQNQLTLLLAQRNQQEDQDVHRNDIVAEEEVTDEQKPVDNNNENNLQEEEDENPYEELIPYGLISDHLDFISDKLEEVEEIATLLDYKELKSAVSEVRDALGDAYDMSNFEEKIEEEEE